MRPWRNTDRDSPRAWTSHGIFEIEEQGVDPALRFRGFNSHGSLDCCLALAYGEIAAAASRLGWLWGCLNPWADAHGYLLPRLAPLVHHRLGIPCDFAPRRLITGRIDMTTSPNKSRKRLIPLAVLVCGLLLFAVVQQAFNLSPFLSDPESQTTLPLWVAFASLNVILLLTLILILLRHLLKLYFEQKSQRLGSRFQRKLLLSFLGVALVPGVFMSFFAYAVLHRNLDKWFSSPLDQAFEPARVGEIARQVEQDATQGAVLKARFLAKHPEVQSVWTSSSQGAVKDLGRIARQLQVPFVVFFGRSGRTLLAYRDGRSYSPTDPRFQEIVRPLDLVRKDHSGQDLPEAMIDRVLTVPWRDGTDADRQKQSLMLAGARSDEGSLIIGSVPPIGMMSFARKLSNLSQDYEQM